MNYRQHVESCTLGRAWAKTKADPDTSDPVACSEFAILNGDSVSTRSAIDTIRDDRAAHVQAVKAAQHFEDDSFLVDNELPAPSPASIDWALPVLRSAALAAQFKQNTESVSRYAKIAYPRLSEAKLTRILTAVSHYYRAAGDLISSRRLLVRALQIASGIRFGPDQAPETNQQVLTLRRQAAFHDLLRAVDFWRHSLFLGSGTLLGFYRDRDFIPSAEDVDLGTTDRAGFASLKETLRSSRRFYLSTEKLGANVVARHANGTEINISLYESRPDGWVKTSHLYEWSFPEFTLGEFATDYGRLPVPVPTDEYLSSMYEDWSSRRSGYDSRIHSPNLTHVSPEEVALVMSGHYLSTYLRGGRIACAEWDRKFEGLPSQTRGYVTPLIQILD